jgi:hypothetical protein
MGLGDAIVVDDRHDVRAGGGDTRVLADRQPTPWLVDVCHLDPAPLGFRVRVCWRATGPLVDDDDRRGLAGPSKDGLEASRQLVRPVHRRDDHGDGGNERGVGHLALLLADI